MPTKILVILSCYGHEIKKTNQIPRSYKNDGFDWPFDLVIVT